MKFTARQLHPREIWSDEIIAKLIEAVPNALGGSFDQLIKIGGFDIETVLRFQAVAVRCKEARESRGLKIKDVALSLKVPQYHIKDIEERGPSNVVPEILHHYLDFLGLRRWYSKWAKSNPKLALQFDLEN